MKIEFEVHSQDSDQINEVKDFWMQQWNKNFMKLVGHVADEKIFNAYDYYYVIRFGGKIGAIMSSAWQNSTQNMTQDSYYEAWPEAGDYLQESKVQNFHKMGMIAAEPTLIPKGFKMTRVLIGCGMRFTKSIPQCQGVVSFPRPDTSVYQACVEWGAKTVKSDLQMYNVPVNFIVLLHSDLKACHVNPQISALVSELWAERRENISTVLAA